MKINPILIRLTQIIEIDPSPGMGGIEVLTKIEIMEITHNIILTIIEIEIHILIKLTPLQILILLIQIIETDPSQGMEEIEVSTKIEIMETINNISHTIIEIIEIHITIILIQIQILTRLIQIIEIDLSLGMVGQEVLNGIEITITPNIVQIIIIGTLSINPTVETNLTIKT